MMQRIFLKTHTALNEEPTKCALRPNVLRETHDSFVHTDGCWVLRHCQTSSTPVTLPLRSRDTYPPADHFYTGVFVLQRLGPILGFDSIKQVKLSSWWTTEVRPFTWQVEDDTEPKNRAVNNL